jgi:hypothetical protein
MQEGYNLALLRRGGKRLEEGRFRWALGRLREIHGSGEQKLAGNPNPTVE